MIEARTCSESVTTRPVEAGRGVATQRASEHLQAEIAALEVRHAAIREANAAFLAATLERIFQTEAAA